MLTQEYVRELFYLETETWTLYWRKDQHGRRPDRIGTAAGSPKHGYIAIDISARRYYAHQIIWLYVYGEWPDRIDHKDGNGFNNDPSNLRLASRSQNSANIERRVHGVEKHGRKFRVRIVHQGSRQTLGPFDTREEAEDAYVEMHLKLFGEHSIYARK